MAYKITLQKKRLDCYITVNLIFFRILCVVIFYYTNRLSHVEKVCQRLPYFYQKATDRNMYIIKYYSPLQSSSVIVSIL